MTEQLLFQQNIWLMKLVNSLEKATAGFSKGMQVELRQPEMRELFDTTKLTDAFNKIPSDLMGVLPKGVGEGVKEVFTPLQDTINRGVDAIVTSIIHSTGDMIGAFLDSSEEEMSVWDKYGEAFKEKVMEYQSKSTENPVVNDELINEAQKLYQKALNESFTTEYEDVIKGGLTPFIESIKESYQRSYNEQEANKSYDETIKEFTSTSPENIMKLIGSSGEQMANAPLSKPKYRVMPMDQAFPMITASIKGIRKMGGLLKKTFVGSLKPLKVMGKSMKSNIAGMQVMTQVASVLTSPLQAFITGVLSPFSVLGDVMGGLGEKLGTLFIPLILKIVEVIFRLQPVIDMLLEALSPIIDVVILLIDQMTPILDLIIQMVVENLPILVELLMAFMPILTELMPIFVVIVEFMMEFSSIVSRIVFNLLPIVTDGISALLTPLSALMDLFQGNITLSEFTHLIADAVRKMLGIIIVGIYDFAREIPGILYKWIKDMFSVKEWF